MGFFDVIKDIGKGVLDAVKERQERILYYKELYRDKSDQELIRMYKSSNGEKLLGIRLLLQERGYEFQPRDDV